MTELQLGNDYFDLWETTDDAERHALIEKVFVDSAVQYVAPANISLEGADAIEANITRVNTENIQKAGLQFQKGKIVRNHNSVHVEWTVAAPNGQTVASGRDFLLLGEDGRATALYMFQG